MSKGHRDRLWQKYRDQGLRQGFFHGYEKLEFLLTFVLPRCDTKPIARKLMENFGSLNEVMRADPDRLTAIEGIGERSAYFLRLVAEFANVLEEEKLNGADLLSTQNLENWLWHELAFEEAEYFLVVFLDSQGGLLRKTRMFRGTLSQTYVFPREIAKEGLQCNAAYCIVAHNHPSGQARPSEQDLILTERLAGTLAQVDIGLKDHLIISKEEVYSLKSEGSLSRPPAEGKL